MDKKRNKRYVIFVAVLFGALTIFTWIKPVDEFSVTERRTLEQFPKVSMESILSGKFMQEFEDYTLDQFPLRDVFRSIKAMTHLYVFGQSDNNEVYIADGYVSKMDYPLSEKAMDNAIRKFESIYQNYIEESDAKVYYSIIPDKNAFLAEKNGYLSYDYTKMASYMENRLANMTYIDIFDLLSIEDYYRTDAHWKQECILDVAQRLGSAMGVKLEKEYETVSLDVPFYGVYYGQLGLPIEPDRLAYLNHKLFADCKIINHENGKEIPMYSMKKAEGRDAYEMFLSGALSVISIENPNATSDKELVVFRDSFGSSLVPLLVEGYEKITILDARYLNERMIGNYVTFDKQDVLFIHSTSVVNNETAFK